MKETIYKEEKESIKELFGGQDDSQSDSQNDSQNGNQKTAQYRIGEDRLKRKKENTVDGSCMADQIIEAINKKVAQNCEKENKQKRRVYFPTQTEIFNFIKSNGIKKVKSFMFFSYYNARGWRDSRGIPIDDWQSLLFKWEENNGEPINEGAVRLSVQ